ncbi:hypothetical protein MSAN_00430900 [Mycena sanguinolenta]|uniref:Uncharacterized protein n=1 Tax=Mycena sanguinolenta TaxID=230812 RepID=A0A8H7DLC0_9AGAR|nr:hypothetical protein MSAN_00430900 [Mycena sanguinolenta]
MWLDRQNRACQARCILLAPPSRATSGDPSLRCMLIQDRTRGSNDCRVAMVTPRFQTPLVVPLLNDPFLPVPPQSLAKVDVVRCTAFDRDELLASIKTRMEIDPSFDPYGIEKARLVDPEGEDELDRLHYL